MTKQLDTVILSAEQYQALRAAHDTADRAARKIDTAVKVPTALCPVILVNGKRLHALAHYAAPLPARLLKRPVANVAAQASALGSAHGRCLVGPAAPIKDQRTAGAVRSQRAARVVSASPTQSTIKKAGKLAVYVENLVLR